MQIAIIGSGRMGAWFARHFKEKGVDVILYDIDVEKAKKTAQKIGVGSAAKFEETLDSEVFFICVNISKTPDAVREIGQKLKKQQMLVEIASLKSKVAKELKKLDCEILSIHPLFGPGARSIVGQNIAVISDSSSINAKEKILPFFEGANITDCSIEEHEKAMAMVLSLPFAMNIAFLEMLQESKVPDGLQGTTFLQQLMIADKVADEEEDLKEELTKNIYFKDVLESYVKKMKEVHSGSHG